MRRISWLSLLILLSLACRTLIPGPALVPARGTPTQAAQGTPAESTSAPPAQATAGAPPAAATAESTSTPTSELPLLELPPGERFSVLLHPDGGIYVGDQVSLEVIAPADVDVLPYQVRVAADPPEGVPLGSFSFGFSGLAGRQQATLLWAWDTSSLPAEQHTLTFSIEPAGPTWTETVTLLPGSTLPAAEREARWAQAESGCCVVHYITGSDAERDLPNLLALADEHAAQVSQQLGADFPEKVHLTLLPRLLGHGGFASGEIAITYGERNYAGGQFPLVLHHELVHFLDGKLTGSLRPSLLGEGLAVYLSGGHFKPETLLPRLAALRELGGYLPLEPLADDFYPAQHETGYLEGAALVEYMVDTWGWDAFWTFYRDIQPHPSGSQARAIEAALQKHFNLSFTELEERFLERLQAEPVDPVEREDIRLTIAFFDAMRRYQRALDPSAYYETAWLADIQQARQRGIVADYLRSPSEPQNIALEALLIQASQRLQAADYQTVEALLGAVNAALDKFEEN